MGGGGGGLKNLLRLDHTAAESAESAVAARPERASAVTRPAAAAAAARLARERVLSWRGQQHQLGQGTDATRCRPRPSSRWFAVSCVVVHR